MTKIIQRHDTAANWSTINPILALGEMGVETDTNKFKFGNGTTSYNELPYAAGEGGSGSGTTLTSIDGGVTYDKLAIGNGLVVDAGDIAWTNPQMNSNSQDGYVLTSSSNNTSDGKSDMYRAFDKDTTTSDYCWYTGSVAMPQWIMLECPEPVRLTSCMIMNEITTPVNFKSGYIQGSNDGSNFDTLYTITDRPDTAGLQVTYTFDNNKYYKYLRVYCTEQWSGPYGDGLSIQEIEFSGYVKSEGAVQTLNAKVDSYTKGETDNLLNAKQDKLTAGDGIQIDNKIISVDTTPCEYNITIPNEEAGTRFEGNLLVQPNNLHTSPVVGQCGCINVPIDLDSFSEIEYVVKFKPTTISTQDCRYCQLFTNAVGYAMFWFDSLDGNLRTIAFDGNGSSSNLVINQSVGQLNISQWYYVRFLITPNSITSSYKLSKDAIWNTIANRSATVNSTTYKPLLEYAPYTFYIGGVIASDIGGTSGTIGAAAKYDLSESFIRVDNTTYNMLGNQNNAIATTEHAGFVQPDGTTITVSSNGVISGQDVKTFTGYSNTGTLVLKSIDGVLQWVAET